MGFGTRRSIVSPQEKTVPPRFAPCHTVWLGCAVIPECLPIRQPRLKEPNQDIQAAVVCSVNWDLFSALASRSGLRRCQAELHLGTVSLRRKGRFCREAASWEPPRK